MWGGGVIRTGWSFGEQMEGADVELGPEPGSMDAEADIPLIENGIGGHSPSAPTSGSGALSRSNSYPDVSLLYIHMIVGPKYRWRSAIENERTC